MGSPERRQNSPERDRRSPPRNPARQPPRRRTYSSTTRDNYDHGYTSRMSEEERQAKIAEMMGDAEKNDDFRWKRVKKSQEDDKREAEREAAAREKNASFL